jgi:hypothetical protein
MFGVIEDEDIRQSIVDARFFFIESTSGLLGV